MNALVHEARKQYEETSYKLALKAAHYDFLNARDTYRSVFVCSSGVVMMLTSRLERLAMRLASRCTRTWSSNTLDSRP